MSSLLDAFEPQRNVYRMLGRVEDPVAPLVGKRLRAERGTGGRVNPVRFVSAAGQVQQEIFDIAPWRHDI